MIGVRVTHCKSGAGSLEGTYLSRLIRGEEPGVGKSTLRRCLTDDRYVPYRPPTTLDIPYWVQTLQVEGLPVTLHRTSLSHGPNPCWH